MNENNIKVLFPEGIETITISKNDYDRLFGQLSYENIILKSKIDKAIKYIDDLCKCSDGTYFNYGDDLSPKYIVDILKENN